MNPGIVILAYARTTKTRQENKQTTKKKNTDAKCKQCIQIRSNPRIIKLTSQPQVGTRHARDVRLESMFYIAKQTDSYTAV